MPRVVINNISWNLPDGSNLFNNINFSCNNEKTGLTGNNGTGKTILTCIITGKTAASRGNVMVEGKISLLPQSLDVYNGRSLYSVFGIEDKYNALQRITAGDGTENDYLILDNDWELEHRLQSAMQKTGIEYLHPDREFSSLSGGEKVRAALTALLMKEPEFLIFDEPTNHLDYEMKDFVYDFIKSCRTGMLIISHDRELLRLMDRIIELTPGQAKIYGGNYDFYVEQKAVETAALENEIQSAEGILNKRIKEKENSIAKQLYRTKSAENRSKDGGIPKIMLNKLKGSGERTLHKVKELHEKRVNDSTDKLSEAKAKLRHIGKMKIDFENTLIPNEKVIVKCEEVNFSPDGQTMLWKENLSFMIRGSERIHLKGVNGSGKSTLLKMIRGILVPSAGKIYTGVKSIGVLDQDVSLLDNSISIYDNMVYHSKGEMPEHEIRIRLARYLFFKDDIYKKASVLSGGERMRAGVACLFAGTNSPELILLDEPVNNLDLSSINQLTIMLKEYTGALIVVSHDSDFIKEIGIDEEMELVK